LGPQLSCDADIDPSALHIRIPLLSIQPLVENAVKHGVASRMGTGFVRLRVKADSESVSVEVTNSGECDLDALANPAGIGLANVRRRLALCYGPGVRLHADSSGGNTTVGFVLPAQPITAAVATAV
jgi:LytS/YehU family sensor histidine kinase